MFYNEWFFIDSKIWNNEFSYELRVQQKWYAKIYIPNIIEWTLNDLKLWEKIVFEEYVNNKIVSCIWLKNFIKTKVNDIPVIIVDNHNHVLFFWFNFFNNPINLVHIDQHSDMKNNSFLIEEKNIDYVFKFVNFKTNVWNYIIPAMKIWLIKNIIQIRTNYFFENLLNISSYEDYILNIDLDFWQFEENINNCLSLNLTKKLMKNAKLITIATSPFFIDQKKSIDILKILIS